MAISADHLDRVRIALSGALNFKDLGRTDWKRQNDVIQEVFCFATMVADLGDRAILVDGRISTRLCRLALASGNLKRFFNGRCHDAGLKTRRIIMFDTVTTGGMGGRGNKPELLHFHGLFEIPEGTNKQILQILLGKVFGKAESLGRRQFHFSHPSWSEHYTHNGVQAKGAIGKMLYAVKNAGPTYRVLKLNEDERRSRATPKSRRSNPDATRLAKAVPSNFNKKIVLCDHRSTRAGREAYEAWVSAERLRDQPVTTALPVSAPATPKVAHDLTLRRRASLG